MRRPLILALAVASLLAAGAVGVIVGASSAPTIRACVQKDGTMRYLASGACKAGEKLLTWNVQGLQGVAGPQGPAGPTGGSGGSAGVAFYLAQGPGPAFDTADVVIQSLKVPAGSYLVDAQALLVAQDAQPGGTTPVAQGVLCGLSTAATGDSYLTSQERVLYPGDSIPFSFPAYVTFAAETTLYLRCGANLPIDQSSGFIDATVAVRRTL